MLSGNKPNQLKNNKNSRSVMIEQKDGSLIPTLDPYNYENPDMHQLIIQIGKTKLTDFDAISSQNIKFNDPANSTEDILFTGVQLQQILTSYSLSQSIGTSYDKCVLNFKMNSITYQNYFGDGLDRIQTGQWICLKKLLSGNDEASKNLEEARIMAFNNNILEKYNQKIEKQRQFNETIPPDAGMGGRTGINSQTQNGTPKSYDFFEEYKNSEQMKQKQKLESYASQIFAKEYVECNIHIQAIFFGVVSSIQSNFNIDPSTGNHFFDVSLICDSFIYPLQSNELLYGAPKLQFKEGEYIKQMNNNATKYKDAVDALFKNGEYWEKFTTQFLTKSKRIESNKNKVDFIDLKDLIQKMLLSLARNILPRFLVEGIANEQEIINDPIQTDKVINPGGYPTLGMLLNVVTEQQHLPIGSDYRQFLPVNAAYSNLLQGFKTNLGTSSVMQTWSLITGTFLTDPALFELFPILVPLSNYTELELKIQKNQLSKNIKQYFSELEDIYPSFNIGEHATELIYNIWIKLGAIPCIVFRWKLLPPEFNLNTQSYQDLILSQIVANYKAFGNIDKNKNNSILLNEETKSRMESLKKASSKAQFKSQEYVFVATESKFKTLNDAQTNGDNYYKLNHDAPFADHLPLLYGKNIVSWSCVNSEDENINIVDVIPPRGGSNIGSGGENLGLGTKDTAIFNLYNILLKGPKLLRTEYPLWDINKAVAQEFLAMVSERLYAIYAEGNKFQSGQITVLGHLPTNIIKGAWIRISLDNQNDKNIDTKYYDYYAYVETIITQCEFDSNTGNYYTVSSITYKRGRFGLMPPTFPDAYTSNSSADHTMEIKKEQKGLMPNSKSNSEIIKELDNKISQGKSAIMGYEVISERQKEQMGSKIYNDYIRGAYAVYIKQNFNRDITTRTQLKNTRRELNETINRSKEQQQELEFYEELLNLANRFEIDLNVKPYYEEQPQKNKSKIKKK